MRCSSFSLYISVLSLVCAAAVADSCTGEAVDPDYTISTNLLKVDDLNILGTTADTVLAIEANSAWTLQVTSGDEQQLGLGQKSGTGTASVRMTPGENPSATASRSWTLRVTTEAGLTRSIAVTQGGAEVSIMVLPEDISVAAGGDTVAVSITCNSHWEAELTGQAPGFVHFRDGRNAGSGNGTLELTIDANAGTAARSGGLKLTATDSQQRQQVRTVSISQAARTYTFLLFRRRVLMPNTGGTFQLGFIAENEWRAAVAVGEWLELSQYRGGSTDEAVTVSVEANPTQNLRTDTISFTILEGGHQAQCEVVQAAQGAPTVTGLTAVADEDGTATLQARYESDADNVGVATECGFYYGTDAGSLTDSGTRVACSVGNGRSERFSCSLTGLLPNVTYYVLAYAVNPRGTGLSEVKQLATAGDKPGEGDLHTPDTP